MPQSFTQQNPSQIYRSKLFSLSTQLYFACNYSYTLTNVWQLTRLDVPQNIDLSLNPTWQSSELVIQANTLAYGLYAFSFNVQISMLTSGNLNGNQTSSVTTYVQIIPTGLAVFAVQNGRSNLLIGSSQVYVLDPLTYSFDFDSVVSMSSLTFVFYCNTVDLTLGPVQTQNTIDLLTYKSNSKLPMTWKQTCFSANSMFFNMILLIKVFF